MAVHYNFEWDPIKARDNPENHGVAFDEAATVFKDPNAISIYDPDHSETEGRWGTMGISEKGRLYAVAIRIISSRKATRHETALYGEST